MQNEKVLLEKRDKTVTIRIPESIHSLIVAESAAKNKECLRFSTMSDIVLIALIEHFNKLE